MKSRGPYRRHSTPRQFSVAINSKSYKTSLRQLFRIYRTDLFLHAASGRRQNNRRIRQAAIEPGRQMHVAGNFNVSVSE